MTITATSAELVLLMVNRRMFSATVGDKIKRKRDEWRPFLKSVGIIGELSDYEVSLLADQIETRTWGRGEQASSRGTCRHACAGMHAGHVSSPAVGPRRADLPGWRRRVAGAQLLPARARRPGV